MKKSKETVTVALWALVMICQLLIIVNHYSNAGKDFGMVKGALTTEPYRLITCAFVHGSGIHILGNSLSLYYIGKDLENSVGTLKFILISFASLIGSSLMVNFFGKYGEYHIGISGIIFGLFIALIIYKYKHRKMIDFMQLVIILAINIIITVSKSNVSWQGHLGGAIAGLITGIALI